MRIPITIPIKGRGFVNQGSGLLSVRGVGGAVSVGSGEQSSRQHLIYLGLYTPWVDAKANVHPRYEAGTSRNMGCHLNMLRNK